MKAVISSKWSKEAKSLVSKHDFNLVTVYYNLLQTPHSVLHKSLPVVYNCQFCGQNINYVAIIESSDKTEVRQVGCDCVEKILGRTWIHFNTMTSMQKKLKESVAKDKRKAKYATEFKNDIEWLNSQDLKYNKFLNDMRDILTTGSRVITNRMIFYMRKLIAESVNTKPQNRVTTFDLDSVLNKIEIVRKKAIEAEFDVSFIDSVSNFVKTHNKITKGQMEGLNSVYIGAKNRIEKKNKKK